MTHNMIYVPIAVMRENSGKKNCCISMQVLYS